MEASTRCWEMLGSLLLFPEARRPTDMCGPDGTEVHSRACKPAGISSVLRGKLGHDGVVSSQQQLCLGRVQDAVFLPLGMGGCCSCSAPRG